MSSEHANLVVDLVGNMEHPAGVNLRGVRGGGVATEENRSRCFFRIVKSNRPFRPLAMPMIVHDDLLRCKRAFGVKKPRHDRGGVSTIGSSGGKTIRCCFLRMKVTESMASRWYPVYTTTPPNTKRPCQGTKTPRTMLCGEFVGAFSHPSGFRDCCPVRPCHRYRC